MSFKKCKTGRALWLIPIISAMWEAEIRRICQPGQKVSEIPVSANKLGIGGHTYNPSYLGGIGRRSLV
jgi:hypothetical protein